MMQPSNSRSKSRRRWAWIIFLALLASLVTWRAWENERFRAASQAWNRAAALADEQARTQSEQAFQRICPFFRSLAEHERSREKAEAALGLPAPLRRTAHPDGEEEYLYKDPASGGHVVLRFRNDRWSGVGLTPYLSIPPKPTRDRFFVACERVRSSIAGWNRGIGPLAWLILLGLLAFARGHRALVSEAMLAVAIICSAAWLLAPNYSLTPRGILSNDMLFWAAFMLIVSAASLVLTRCHLYYTPAYPECGNCGYNLTGNTSGICPECGQSCPSDRTDGNR